MKHVDTSVASGASLPGTAKATRVRVNAFLERIRPALEKLWSECGKSRKTHKDAPACVLFFSITNGLQRAHVVTVKGEELQEAWLAGVERIKAWSEKQTEAPIWRRAAAVVRLSAGQSRAKIRAAHGSIRLSR